MSTIINNDPDSIRIRRNKATLSVVGIGVAAFGCWSIIKMIMECLIGPVRGNIIEDLMDDDIIVTILTEVVLIMIMITDVLLRFYIGLSARREARGTSRSRKYIVVAIIVFLFNAWGLIEIAVDIVTMDNQGIRDYVSFFVELTSLVILLELIIVSHNCRRKGGGNAA